MASTFTADTALLASAAGLRPCHRATLTAAMPSMLRRGWVAQTRNAMKVPVWYATPLGESVLYLDHLARS